MKEIYTPAEMEVIFFEGVDVICNSCDYETPEFCMWEED